MMVASFGMIQTTGPALALVIFTTLLAGLTLTPSLLAIFGRRLFWPLHEQTRTEGSDEKGVWAALARRIVGRPGLLAVAGLGCCWPRRCSPCRGSSRTSTSWPGAARRCPSLASAFDTLERAPAPGPADAAQRPGEGAGRRSLQPRVADGDGAAGDEDRRPAGRPVRQQRRRPRGRGQSGRHPAAVRPAGGHRRRILQAAQHRPQRRAERCFAGEHQLDGLLRRWAREGLSPGGWIGPDRCRGGPGHDPEGGRERAPAGQPGEPARDDRRRDPEGRGVSRRLLRRRRRRS